MSTTKCKWDFCISAYACAMACSADLLGRNPLLLSLNLASQIGSRICRIHCWTILSHIAGIPSGLNFPFGFGISTLLTALGLYHWSFFLTTSTNFVSGIFSISLIVSLLRLYCFQSCVLYFDKQGECFPRSQWVAWDYWKSSHARYLRTMCQAYFASHNTPNGVFLSSFSASSLPQASPPFGFDFLCHTRSCECLLCYYLKIING